MELLDDFKLGKLVKQGGFQSGVALGGKWVQLRWQDGLSGIVSGLMKNSFAACGFRLRNVALYLLGAFAFDVLPFLALLFAVGTPRKVAALCVFIVLVLHANGSHAGRVSPFYALPPPSGPAGAVLALLLARQGVDVMLLEAHKDFDRDFRGDTVHPSTLEILDEIGLAGRLHQLRHVKVFAPTLRAVGGSFTPFDLRRLKTRFPYIMLMHQPIFLEFLAEEAAKYPNFRLLMQANVLELIEEGSEIRGVRYQSPHGWHEVRASLTVGADGRFSRVRQQARFVPIKTSAPMDVLWFRLPRLPEDPQVTGGATGGVSRG